MTQPEYAGGHVLKDSKGNIINTREYYYTNTHGDSVVFQEHSYPHIGSEGPHFNVRESKNLRHGAFPGTKSHYPFNH